jgi:hypothetical protein
MGYCKELCEQIGLRDCVVYEKDDQRNVLIQRAAFGPKNPYGRVILNSIEIESGKGIVGTGGADRKSRDH